MIQVENLRKAYGSTMAVDDISFSVSEGEIFGLLGPNGAGKTTTVECLQGLRRADSGRLRVLDLDPQSDTRKLRRVIGSQLQASALPDRIKVWEALDLFSSVNASTGSWKALMDQWGLAGKRNAMFGNLSGGQRQRLLIALSLVNEPRLVFLDEMTTGLDPAARRVAWDLIRAIRDRGTTVVLVTHFMDEAEQLCDRIAVCDKGRIVATDTPQRLIDRFNGQVRIRFSADHGEIPDLMKIRGVLRVDRKNQTVTVTGKAAAVTPVASALWEGGITPEDFRVERPTLEDVFLELTEHRSGD